MTVSTLESGSHPQKIHWFRRNYIELWFGTICGSTKVPASPAFLKDLFFFDGHDTTAWWLGRDELLSKEYQITRVFFLKPPLNIWCRFPCFFFRWIVYLDVVRTVGSSSPKRHFLLSMALHSLFLWPPTWSIFYFWRDFSIQLVHNFYTPET